MEAKDKKLLLAFMISGCDQLGSDLRMFTSDICRVAESGPQVPKDIDLVRLVFSYVMVQLAIAKTEQEN